MLCMGTLQKPSGRQMGRAGCLWQSLLQKQKQEADTERNTALRYKEGSCVNDKDDGMQEQCVLHPFKLMFHDFGQTITDFGEIGASFEPSDGFYY